MMLPRLLAWSAVMLVTSLAPALAAGSCGGMQLGPVEVTQSARTLGGAKVGDPLGLYRSLIAADAQSAGLGSGAPIRVEVHLVSAERRLTSAYLNGDQWPLRTVTLSLQAAASDPHTGRRLAELDLPNLPLVGNSSFEAISAYLTNDFAQPLASMITVACEELGPVQPAIQPVTAGQPPAPAYSRGGVAVSLQPVAQACDSALPNRHVAIIMGVSRYRSVRDDQGVHANQINLRYADHDAQDVADFLSDGGRTGRAWDVVRLINDQATKARMQDTLRQALAGAQCGDVVLLFYAGHGLNVGNRDVALLPYDYDTANTDTAVSFNWLKDEIAASKALQVVAFIDACNSGSMRLGARGPGAGGINVNLLGVEQRVGRMRTIMASTSNGELAYEDPSLKHGVFSYFLLKALRGDFGAQVAPVGQPLALGPTFDYVRESVSHYVNTNRKLFGDDATQVPTFLGDLAGNFKNWPLR